MEAIAYSRLDVDVGAESPARVHSHGTYRQRLKQAQSMALDHDQFDNVHTLDHGAWLNALAYAPDSSVLASGGGDCKVAVWSTTTHERLHTLDHRCNVRALDHGVTSVRSPTLPTHRSSLRVALTARWPCGARPPTSASTRSTTGMLSVRSPTLPTHRVLAWGGSGCKVAVWSMTTHERLHTLDHGGNVHALAYAPDSSALASGGANGKVKGLLCSTGATLNQIYELEAPEAAAHVGNTEFAWPFVRLQAPMWHFPSPLGSPARSCSFIALLAMATTACSFGSCRGYSLLVRPSSSLSNKQEHHPSSRAPSRRNS